MKPSLLRELKRRKVLRTCVWYILLCWSALEVLDILAPLVGIDEYLAPRLLIAAAVLGLPVTFALAWFFQITPQGIIRTPGFVERRILSNIAPINDRRDKSWSFFRRRRPRREFAWILSAETGPLAGQSYGVTQSITLGRSPGCDVAVVSPHVSRMHAKLVVENDSLFIQDLGSANGTMVNDQLILSKHPLHDADEIRIHDIVFRVSATDKDQAPTQYATDDVTFIDTSGAGRQGRNDP